MKAVIFDVDGVLVDSFNANLKYYQDLFIYAGYPAPTKAEYQRMHSKTLKENIKLFLDSASDDEIDRVWQIGADRVSIRYPTELLKVPDDLTAVLNFLSKKYQLAIVTARIKFRDRIKEVSQLSNFSHLFKVIVDYEDTANHKPHPEPLLLAAKKLGIKPEEAVYIGDSESDIEAAHAAGMKIISYPKKLKGADGWISKFSQLEQATILLF
jgi:phosphoglycolate phosphatase